MMALLGKSRNKVDFTGPPRDIAWVRSAKGGFFNFLNLEPEEMGLGGISAVFVIWHKGLRPQWVYIGRTDDLATTFEELRDDDGIRDYQMHGGLFTTWSMLKPEYQPGVERYLNQVMSPLEENPDAPDEDEPQIPVFLPGAPTG